MRVSDIPVPRESLLCAGLAQLPSACSVMVPGCPPGLVGIQRAGVKVPQRRCTAMPDGGAGGKELEGPVSFFACGTFWVRTEDFPFLPCPGKVKRKHPPGQHKCHKEQGAELSTATGGRTWVGYKPTGDAEPRTLKGRQQALPHAVRCWCTCPCECHWLYSHLGSRLSLGILGGDVRWSSGEIVAGGRGKGTFKSERVWVVVWRDGCQKWGSDPGLRLWGIWGGVRQQRTHSPALGR